MTNLNPYKYPQFDCFQISGKKEMFLEQVVSTVDFWKAQVWGEA